MVVERVDSDLWLLITSTIQDEDTINELLEHADIGSESGVRLLIHFKATLTRATGARLVHFAQCHFGAPVQKRTSIFSRLASNDG